MRHSPRDMVVGGTKVPKDTMLMIPIWHVQRSPFNWTDPDVFRPQRFLREFGASRGTPDAAHSCVSRARVRACVRACVRLARAGGRALACLFLLRASL